jgi:hypothetical protein
VNQAVEIPYAGRTRRKLARSYTTLRFPDDRMNHALCINRTWVNTCASLLRMAHGLYISVRGIKDAEEQDGKCRRTDAASKTRSKVAKTGIHVNAVTAARTASTTQLPNTAFTPSLDGALSEGEVDDVDEIAKDDVEGEDEVPEDKVEGEDETPEEATMDDCKPDISLIDPPHSAVIPQEYIWRQCAVFMEIKRHAHEGPLTY